MKLCLNCHKQFTDEVELCPHEGSFLVPLPSDPLLGTLIDERYRVESLIAKGAVGSVYKAKQELLGRQVALKVLHGYLGADPESLVRFHREAKAISRLEHPHLLTLYDFGMTSDGQPYFVMDLLNGTTLAKVLTTEGRMETPRALQIIKQVLEALSEAHKKGIVHRDIKPPNIVLTEKEEAKEFVKLVDFSIAKMADNSTVDPVQLTVDGIICGSPAYMSPEQCRGSDVDGRSDIYSIGIVMFEALTGKRPFSAKDLVSLMYLHVNDEPPKLSDIEPGLQFPPQLESVVASTLSKDPAARPQSVEELLARLDKISTECAESIAAIPKPTGFSAPDVNEAVSPLFTTDAERRQTASSDNQDVFIGVRNKAVSHNNNQPDRPAQEAGNHNGFKEIDSTASLIELSNADLPSFLSLDESPKVEAQQFDATPSSSSSDSMMAMSMQPANAQSISHSYDLRSPEMIADHARNNEGLAPQVTPQTNSQNTQRYEEPQSRSRDTRNSGSYSQDSSTHYHSESEWSPNALKTILPLIIVLVIGVIGILKIWDLATPDTPAELLRKGQTEQAISLLENRQHAGKRLSSDETSTLHTAYLNLARKYGNQNKLNQAVATLKKVPAGSPLQDTASRLMQAYKHQLLMSGGR